MSFSRIQPGGDARGDWAQINLLGEDVRAIADRLRTAEAELDRWRKGRRGGGGWTYKGIWDFTEAYAVDDVVKVVGAGMGTYLCQVAHTPTQDPETSAWTGDHPPYLGQIDTVSGDQYWTLLVASGSGIWA